MPKQTGFWSVDDRLRELSAQGDPLEKLLEIVDFELFRPVLAEAIGPTDRAKGGRPPFDAVLKLEMLYLMAQHGLSFEQTEHLVRDRLSWMRFCGPSIADPVPDANTLWDFREALIRAGAFDKLFEQLDRAIKEAGYLPMSGQIVDASLVAAPRQRNTDEEKAAIRAGKTAAEIWPDKPAKAAQNDTDARWTLKTSKGKVEADGTIKRDLAIPEFGYKSHISIDQRHGFIRRQKVTDAAAHDGARLREGLLDPTNTASDARRGLLAIHGPIPPIGLTQPPERGPRIRGICSALVREEDRCARAVSMKSRSSGSCGNTRPGRSSTSFVGGTTCRRPRSTNGGRSTAG